jgi:hypothetical protein
MLAFAISARADFLARLQFIGDYLELEILAIVQH